MKPNLKLLAGLAALAVCAAAQAATTTTTMSVSMTVPVSCTVSATPMAFGTGTGTTVLTAQATIGVNCASGAAYNVAIDSGRNFLSVGARRRMASGFNFVSYRLTKTAGGADWGDSDFANTFAPGSSVAGTGTGANRALTVFGETIGAASVPAGSYSDGVVVTVHF